MNDALYKQQKAFEIFENVMQAAAAIIKAVTEIPRYKLPRIATAARKRRSIGLARVALTLCMGVSNIASVISQPIPKYKLGTHE